MTLAHEPQHTIRAIMAGIGFPHPRDSGCVPGGWLYLDKDHDRRRCDRVKPVDADPRRHCRLACAESGLGRCALDRIGGHGPADILVNNAGIVMNALSLEVDGNDWRRVLDVNLHRVFHTSRAFGRHMGAAGCGSVLDISAICGEVTVDLLPQAADNAAKAEVNLLTKSLAVEWAARSASMRSCRAILRPN